MGHRRVTQQPKQIVLYAGDGHPLIDPSYPPLRLYIDESGVGGMQHAYMTIGTLYNLRGEAEREVRRIFAKARRHWLKGKQLREIPIFKAAATPPKLRTRIVQLLAAVPGMFFLPFTLRKSSFYLRHAVWEYSLMASFSAFVLGMWARSPSLEIVWKPGTNRLDLGVLRKMFSEYAESGASQLKLPVQRVQVTQRVAELHREPMLQAVDFFTNAEWRKYERGDSDADSYEKGTMKIIHVLMES